MNFGSEPIRCPEGGITVYGIQKSNTFSPIRLKAQRLAAWSVTIERHNLGTISHHCSCSHPNEVRSGRRSVKQLFFFKEA
jgi:hypothetical protein